MPSQSLLQVRGRSFLPVALVVVFGCSGAFAAPASQRARTSSAPLSQFVASCVVTPIAAAIPTRFQPESERPRPASAQELSRLMTDEEIASLLRDLEPVNIGTGNDVAISAVARSAELSAERASVLVGDVLTVLAELHAQETLNRVRQAGGASAGASAWATKALQDIHGCAQSRFASRGGDDAVASSARIVQNHRAALERAVLQTFRGK
jgi:hypothetical protein